MVIKILKANVKKSAYILIKLNFICNQDEYCSPTIAEIVYFHVLYVSCLYSARTWG